MTLLHSSLDRSNLGNAKTAGLAEDLNLKGNQYSLVLTFYYVVFGPPAGLITKAISAKYSVSSMMLFFGTESAATAAVKSFGGLLACRMRVGLFEAGFLTS